MSNTLSDLQCSEYASGMTIYNNCLWNLRASPSKKKHHCVENFLSEPEHAISAMSKDGNASSSSLNLFKR